MSTVLTKRPLVYVFSINDISQLSLVTKFLYGFILIYCFYFLIYPQCDFPITTTEDVIVKVTSPFYITLSKRVFPVLTLISFAPLNVFCLYLRHFLSWFSSLHWSLLSILLLISCLNLKSWGFSPSFRPLFSLCSFPGWSYQFLWI